LLGVCSALLLTAPILLRSLRALLAERAPGGWLPSLLEVSLAVLGVVALCTVVVSVVSDLRSRLGGGRRGSRWRRHRRPWEEYLMECDAEDAQRALHAFSHAVHHRPSPSFPVKNPRSAATLRLVEATPWPLGSARARQQGRPGPATQLGFPVAERESVTHEAPRKPVWRSEDPVYYTPYPFSVWTFHDSRVEDYEYELRQPNRTWLWAALLFAGAALAAVFWWQAYGISMPFSV